MNEKYVARGNAVASRILGSETAIMSAVDSTLFILNEVATEIWLAADGKTPLSDIVKHRICEKFEVTPDLAYSDAEEFVDALARHGILQVAAFPIADPGESASVAS